MVRRVEDVQALVSGDLHEVEGLLSRAAQMGPEPGRHAAEHLVAGGGKRIRPLALLLAHACFAPPTPAAQQMAVVVELVHSATLMHDDVIDDGDERRGKPTARRVWGNAVSVLAGDLLLVRALETTAVHAPALMSSLLVTLRRLVEGEVIQLRGRVALDPSEATYERILRDKTASLFGWATRAGALLAGADESCVERMGSFGERLGVAFQLVDDLLDYTDVDTGKTPLADLSEGKLTLPLVLTCASNPELLAELERIHAGDLEPVAAVSRAVRSSGACDEVRRRAQSFTAEALSALRGVAPTPARELLEGVATGLVQRVV
ncbi:MAG: polyprenyl synthetase family protein [Polyangiaceae bacterium]